MRANVTPIPLLTAADASTTQTSTVLSLNQVFGLSLEATFVGSCQGTVKLQCSVNYQQDLEGNVMVAGTWADITSSDQAISTSDTGVIWNVPTPNYPWIRAVWTSSGGSGTRTVTVVAFIRSF